MSVIYLCGHYILDIILWGLGNLIYVIPVGLYYLRIYYRAVVADRLTLYERGLKGWDWFMSVTRSLRDVGKSVVGGLKMG